MAPVTRSIELYRPKLTVGTTLDVSAGGEAGVDWANVGSPTTTVALTGTTVAVTQKVDVDTIKTSVQTAVEAGLVTHRLDELLNADSDIDGLTPPAVGSVFHELLTKTAGSFTYDQTTDSLEAIRDKETDIETDTAEIGVAGAGLTAINLPDQTMNITGTITGNLSGSVGSVTGAVGSVTGAVGSVTGAVGSVTGAVGSVAGNVGGNVTGSVGSLAAQAKTDVKAQVVDALATDTYAEPTGVPAATASLSAKIGVLHMALRNQVNVTATKKTFYNDGGAAAWEKDLSDDGTTYSESEGNVI